MSKKFVSVVTTIQGPTNCVRELVRRLAQIDAELLVIGDSKGPFTYDLPGTRLYTVEDQLKLPFTLAPLLPTKHYARKNLGYLLAFAEQAQCIYETDDDNMPLQHWQPREQSCTAAALAGRPWMNVYRLYSDKLIWPRGFPLNLVTDAKTYDRAGSSPAAKVNAPIQQGLADGSPDVDAVWRLILDQDVRFDQKPSVFLPAGTWCPFNSQTTWWWPVAYPLMYLPSYCSFRMTDIWRSFIAQRCLWELGTGLVFHTAEAFQERNPHNLMRDFSDEIPGYNGNARLAELLGGLMLQPGEQNVGSNVAACYELLIREGFFPEKEQPLVQAWLADVATVTT